MRVFQQSCFAMNQSLNSSFDLKDLFQVVFPPFPSESLVPQCLQSLNSPFDLEDFLKMLAVFSFILVIDSFDL